MLTSSAECDAAPNADFQRVFQTAPVAMVVLDRELRYLACNEAMAAINGLPWREHIGRSVREVLPDLAGELEPRFRSALAEGRSTQDVRVAGSTPGRQGARRLWLESITPLPGRGGDVGQLLVGVQEITGAEDAEAALRDSERKFRASLQLTADSFSILRAVRDEDGQVRDFVWEYANPSAETALGRGPLAGRRLLEVCPGAGGHPALFDRYVRLLSEKSPDEVEVEFERGGVRRLCRNSAVAIDDDRLAVALQDLSEHLRTEENLRLISAEFHHRIKNLIAIAVALVRQTSRTTTDVACLSEALVSRLMALGSAQDLLMRSTGAVRLDDVVRGVLRPFDFRRLRVRSGPPVTLPEASVVPISLALNELATNAVKHGALSGPGGQVDLGWNAVATDVVMTWTEMSPRPVGRPSRRGFGSRLLADSVANMPGGRLRQEFGAEGLMVEIGFEAGSAAL